MKEQVNFSDEKYNDHNIKWTFQKREPVFSYVKETKELFGYMLEKIGEFLTYSKRLRRKKV